MGSPSGWVPVPAQAPGLASRSEMGLVTVSGLKSASESPESCTAHSLLMIERRQQAKSPGLGLLEPSKAFDSLISLHFYSGQRHSQYMSCPLTIHRQPRTHEPFQTTH